MTIRNIHHVGLVVPDLPRALAFWRDTVGLPFISESDVPDEGVHSAVLSMGNCLVILMHPIAEGFPASEFLARTSGGIHHFAFETDDLDAEKASLEAKGVGVRLSEGIGRKLYVDQAATAGLFVEIVQPPEPTALGGEVDALFTHLVILVHETKDVFGSARMWEKTFGLQVESYLNAPEGDNRHVMIPSGAPGSVYIEALMPQDPNGKNMAYLNRAGDNLFQLGVRCRDIDEAVARLSAAGYRVQQSEGMDQGRLATFVHPKSTDNVFVAVFPMGPIPSGPVPY